MGEDLVYPLKVSLKDLYNGTTRKLSLSRHIICSKCYGYVAIKVWFCFFFLVQLQNEAYTQGVYLRSTNGSKGSKSITLMKCSGCQGIGMKVVIRQLGSSIIQKMHHPCNECRGTGETINNKDCGEGHAEWTENHIPWKG